MKTILALALTAVALTGCAGTQREPHAAKADTLASYPQITVEHGLRNFIVVGDPVVTRGDVLAVSVPTRLTSNEGEQARVQYRFIFLNDRGVPLRDQPDWRYMLLEPHQQVFLAANSTDTASDWRMEIRSNR